MANKPVIFKNVFKPKLFWELFVPKASLTHFRIGRHENKVKHLFYFGLAIILPNQIQLLDIETIKKRKLTPTNAVLELILIMNHFCMMCWDAIVLTG
jgi:hypothetical protein